MTNNPGLPSDQEQINVEITVLHFLITCIILNLPSGTQAAIVSDLKDGIARNAAEGQFSPAGIRHLAEITNAIEVIVNRLGGLR